ncbi:hypothetical protein FB45DRAFT_902140 [Roridomyces roridus]|uniref:Protein kinase domain-containing protein n=1 Tax=Roridomyces roridus TaxID=1738132 RepID=A0AAD7FX27_9AGAR|nr:hypothetical protein FB45DRAFT_902140 [Roridomyces roridus]
MVPMDDERTVVRDNQIQSTLDASGAGLAGAFFPNAHNLCVTGGTFTSHINVTNSAPALFEDVRRIPRSDIDLHMEVRLGENDAVAYRSKTRGAVRRVCSARVGGDDSEKSVILYEGETAEEEWRRFVSWHSNVWHPNIVQIFGVSTFSGIYAAVVNDELLPYKHFLHAFDPSPIALVYLFASWNMQGDDVDEAFGHQYGDVEPTHWIRRSTGRLCIDFAPSGIDRPPMYAMDELLIVGPFINLNDGNWEAKTAQALTIKVFHHFCAWSMVNNEYLELRLDDEVDLGIVISARFGDKCDDTIAYLPEDYLPKAESFSVEWLCGLVDRKVMESGWVRFVASDICNRRIKCVISMWDVETFINIWWLCQANHIFIRAQVTSHLRAYALVLGCRFRVDISSAPTKAIPHGFLFLCPPEQFQSGPNSVRWPQNPWFWSLEPDGESRLSEEDAAKHGFPEIELGLDLWIRCWDDLVYRGLREFHAAKGFDPDSQDLTIELGYPLFELSSGVEGGLFAQVRDEAEDSEATLSPHSEGIAFNDNDPSRSQVDALPWSSVDFIKLVLILGSLIHLALKSYVA